MNERIGPDAPASPGETPVRETGAVPVELRPPIAGGSRAQGAQEPDGHPAWRRFALAGGAAMFVAMGLGRFSYSAMVPALVQAGVASPVEAGRVGMANLLGFLAGAAASVPLARRLGRGTVLRGALAITVLGLWTSALPGYLGLAVVRGGIGFATGLVMVLSLSIIAETAPVLRRPAAASYMFSGVGVGILSAGLLVPLLVGAGLTAAWVALAMVGTAGAAFALWAWTPAPPMIGPPARTRGTAPSRAIATTEMGLLVFSHALFSVSIVPHTLYWVDYLARDQGLGLAVGGLHWMLVGLFAILGPVLTAILARHVGTIAALVLALLALGAGVAGPALSVATPVLVVSSMLFGAQPGVSSLLAARARDLGEPQAMPAVMRVMILANALGAVAAGILVPIGYAWFHAAAPLFLVAGAALVVAAVAAAPWRRRT